MSDTPFMLTSSGLLVDVGFGGPPQPGPGSMGPPIATPLLPAATSLLRGIGEHPVAGQLNGLRGTLECYFMTGAPGSIRMVALLVGDPGCIGIGLDAANNPFGLVYDLFGNPIAILPLPMGSPPAGISMIIRLVWDSQNPQIVISTHGRMAISNVTLPWTSFVPSRMWVGGTDAILPYPDFNGVVQRVQASNVVTSQTGLNVTSAPVVLMHSEIFGNASIGAHAVVTQHLNAGPSAGSLVAGDALVTPTFTGLLGSVYSKPAHVVLGF